MKTWTAEEIVAKFQYSFACTEESFDVDGFTVEIVRDDCAENPHDRGDCESPAIWLHHGLHEYGDERLGDVIWNLSLAIIARKWRALADAVDVSHDDLQALAEEYKRDNGGCINNARQQVLGEALDELKAEAERNSYSGDYLDALRTIYRLIGVPAETFTRNGYCQGDVALGLIVMTPKWKAHVGAPHATMRRIKEAEADMSLQADEYAAWLWGDVYGFRIEDETGDEVDSCYGFYVFGELDPIKSGIAEAICESLNWEIKKSTEAKADAFVSEMELARPDLAPAYL